MACPVHDLLTRYGVQVDKFTRQQKMAFLTHHHSDHTQGLDSVSDEHLYATKTTLALAGRANGHALRYFEWSHVHKHIRVQLLPAYHCDGSCMIWFHFLPDNQHVLYTGDFRWNLVMNDWFRDITFDAVYYDDTFLSFDQSIPSLQESRADAKEWFNTHPQGFIHAGVLGIEQILSTIPNVNYQLHPIFSPETRRGRELRYLLSDRLNESSPYILHNNRKANEEEKKQPWLIPTCLPILRGDPLKKTIDPDLQETVLFFCTHANRIELTKFKLAVKTKQFIPCGHGPK